MEIRLKIKLVELGIKNYEIAQRLGWHPSKLSQIVNGASIPSMEEKAQIAKVLGADVGEIFHLKTESPQ